MIDGRDPLLARTLNGERASERANTEQGSSRSSFYRVSVYFVPIFFSLVRALLLTYLPLLNYTLVLLLYYTFTPVHYIPCPRPV